MPVDLSKLLADRAGGPNSVRISRNVFRQQPGPAQQAPFARNVFPPWVYKLPSSKDFNVNQYASVLAAGNGSQVTPVSVQIPETNVGYIQIFGIYVLTPTASTNISFSLHINGSPVEGWDNIIPPPGVANFVVQNFADLQVRIPDGAKIEVVVSNTDANGPWTVGAKVSGWFHSQIEEQRIYGTL